MNAVDQHNAHIRQQIEAEKERTHFTENTAMTEDNNEDDDIDLRGEGFANHLVKIGLIHWDAIEDPDGYDNARIEGIVFSLARNLRRAFEAATKSVPPDARLKSITEFLSETSTSLHRTSKKLICPDEKWLGSFSSEAACRFCAAINNKHEFRMQQLEASLTQPAPAVVRDEGLVHLLEQLLFATENADETGYVEDVGFFNLEALQEKARKAIDILRDNVKAKQKG